MAVRIQKSALYANAEQAIKEIEEVLDGRVDIDNDGGPNGYMRIQTEIEIIKSALSLMKTYYRDSEKDQEK